MKPTKRSDGRWMLQVQKNGIRKTFYGKTSKECIEKAKDWDGTASSKTLCKTSLKNWMDNYVSVKSQATIQQYKSIIKLYIEPVIGLMPVSKVLPANCQKAINIMAKKGLSTTTMRHAKKVMHTFFEHERKMKRTIKINPCLDLTIPKIKTTRSRRAATPEELKMIWGILDGTHYFYCYQFLFMTGLRPSEACGIKISNIKGDKIKISETRTRYDIGNGKTDNAERILNISPGMIDIINNQRSYLKSKFEKKPVYLFPNKNGGPSNSGLLTKTWGRYMSGHTDLTPYELRHTFVSLMYDKMPLKELQEHIGHSSSMDTGTTYAHIFDNAKSDVSIIDNTMLKYTKKDSGNDKKSTALKTINL